ncbi:MAG: glycogen/starch/alpha-glucan phosphorylase, partial [Chlamydiae bacterium]|nr:glycogen/starch/alpha-glucan phosphorylase [Chlamydiota bacterium]
KYPGDEERVRRMSIIEGGQVKMAYLATHGSRKVNGVAALHSEILKKTLLKDFYEMYPEKFTNVTNGVTQRRWILYCNSRLSEFISKRIGKEWITQFHKIEALHAFAEEEESLLEFLEIKRENKKRLRQYLSMQNPLRDFRGRVQSYTVPLEEDALYDVQIKRIHEYKRQLLNILHALMLYFELKANLNARSVRRQIIFAGKAAPGYEIAKAIIQLIYAVARKINQDPSVRSKLCVLFVENYNVSKAEVLIPAADLSEQISTAGMEASGTGNMKLSMNGALTIGTEDGANIEMHRAVTDAWWPFSFGSSSEEVRSLWEKGSYNPWTIYLKEPAIKQAIDAIRDGFLAETEQEQELLIKVYKELLDGQYSPHADRYFILNDLMSYYATQRKVEELFESPKMWAKYCLHNIASMGAFSIDESTHNYAKEVWGISPCPVDSAYLSEIRAEYSEHDKCRIL